MTTQKEAFQQAVDLIHKGELDKARDLLSRLLKADSKNIDYWLWMSTVVKTPKERVYCLREILAIDPKNEEASLGLRMLGEQAPAPDPSQSFSMEQIPWKTRLELADEYPSTQKGLKSRVLVYSVLGIIVIAVLGIGIYMALHPAKKNDMSTVKRWTLTSTMTATETTTPQPSPTGGFAAIVIPQDITFTPTALYVATPHNRFEAYSAGMRAYEKGDWASAIDFFNQVLQSEPNSPDIYYHIGDCYLYLGKYTEANTAYQSALSIDSNFGPAYYGKGRVILAQSPSKAEDALDLFQKAIAKDPQMYEAYLEMAKAAITMNDASTALGWLDKYVQYAPENSTTALLRAEAYLQQGNAEKALSSIEESIKQDPTNVEAYKVQAEAMQLNGQYEGSIPSLLAVVKNSPLDMDSQTLLARAYYEIGNTDEAMSLINTLIGQDSKNTEAYQLRGDIHLEQGKYDEANSDFNAVLRVDYNNFDANVGIGRVFLAQSLAGAAFNKFDYTEKLVQTDAQKATLIYWKAKCLQGLNEEESAIKKFNEALDYGNGALPKNLREDALAQIAASYTATPTVTPSPTPKPSTTPSVMKTSAASVTAATTAISTP